MVEIKDLDTRGSRSSSVPIYQQTKQELIRKMKNVWENKFENNPIYRDYNFEGILNSVEVPSKSSHFEDYLKYEILDAILQEISLPL